jgi:hypothetical protein
MLLNYLSYNFENGILATRPWYEMSHYEKAKNSESTNSHNRVSDKFEKPGYR